MNKIISWCKKNNYHIIGASINEEGGVSAYLHHELTPEMIALISTEKLLGGYTSVQGWIPFNAYVWFYKDKWIWFLHVGDDIQKLQAKTLQDLQNKILTKFKSDDSSPLPS